MDLLKPIITFLKENKIYFSPLKSDEWMQDLMLLTDILNHLQTLNLVLQGKDKIISDLTQTIFSFQNKIRIFQRDILSKIFSHFPYFSQRINTFLNIEEKD